MGLVLLAGVAASCARGRPASDPLGVPDALMSLESAAEDAYDLALFSRDADVTGVANDIAAAWYVARVECVRAGARTEDIRVMDAAVVGLRTAASGPTSSIRLARVANAVSAGVDDLFALFPARVPPAVLALDYGGREVILDAREGAFDHARPHIDALQQTFAALREPLTTANGSTVMEAYDASIAAMRAAVASHDAVALEEAATTGLELVDSMERLFEAVPTGQ